MHILVASDLHLDSRIDAKSEALIKFNRAWAALAPVLSDIDALMLLGDLTDDGAAAAYLPICEAVARSNAPVLAVAGNHDNAAVLREQLGLEQQRVGDRYHQRADVARGRLLALDTSWPDRPSGALTEPCLEWLSDELAGARGAPVVIGMHHSPLATGLPELDGMGLTEGREAFLEIVERHSGPVAVVGGHFHVARTCFRRGVQHVLNPTFCARPGQWRLWPISREIAPRGNGATALRLDPDGAWQVEFIGGW